MTLPVITQIKQVKKWWCRRMTRAQGMAIVALFAVFTVVGMNVLYLPVHVISEHHGLESFSAHDHESRHHDDACQDKHPEHDDADHDLPSSRPLASVVAPVSISLAIIFILPPPCLVTQAVETHWYPTCIDSDRAPPGPSRAPPV